MVYLSTEDCSVCKVLKPKVIEIVKSKFPKLDFLSIDLAEQKEIAAQNMVFTVPTILVFFNGKEYIRKSRNVGINQLYEEISKPYAILFD